MNRQILSRLLGRYFGFDERYAGWLVANLEHLNPGSLEILKDLDPNDFDHIRYSTVVAINDGRERGTFNRIMRVVKENLGPGKKNILEKGAIESVKCSRILSLREFSKVVEIAVTSDIYKGLDRHYYDGAPLHEWLQVNQEKKENDQFESKEDIFQAL